MQAIGEKIEAAALETMALENTSAELEAAARAYAAVAAKCLAPRRALAERGRGLVDSGRRDTGLIWLRRAESMGNLNFPDPSSLGSEIDAAAGQWLRRFDELVE